jgi:hypothetical protein
VPLKKRDTSGGNILRKKQRNRNNEERKIGKKQRGRISERQTCTDYWIKAKSFGLFVNCLMKLYHLEG